MIDLHSHTWFSDGELAPETLLQRAQSLGIHYLAITDHDCIAAHQALVGRPLPKRLTLVSGVEISCGWENQEIHVLGLLIDLDHGKLNALLASQQQRRRERADAIDRRMQRGGICGLGSYLNTLPCESISRSHVADFLVQHGHAANKQQAFRKFLGSKGRFYQVPQWCGIEEAVSAIRSAGGIAVLAHPDRYPLNKPRFRRLLDEFCETGGEGLEASYSNLNPDVMKHLAAECAERGLWASGGSDFHSPRQHWMDLGKIRSLPAACVGQCIWHHPRWRALYGPTELT